MTEIINKAAPVRVRFAPSPTGYLHVGGGRTALFNWLYARKERGTMVLRIEDTDAERNKPELVEGIIEALKWLGLDWDMGPFVQTQRLPLYEQALAQLRQRELVYPCTCSRGDIERAASAPHAEHEGPTYPGTCARRRAADAATLGERPFAWRFRASSLAWSFEDRFCGKVTPAADGDFVVWKSANTPAYQLAVVVDDAAQGITEVIRGDDLVPSTSGT